MENGKDANVKFYLQGDSVLVTAVKLTAFYKLNDALNEFEEEATILENNEISAHSYQDKGKTDGLLNAIVK